MDQTVAAAADIARLQTLLELQRAAHLRDPVPSVAQRRARLERLGAAIKGATVAIARAVSEDFGNRSPQETVLAEVFTSLEAIRYTARHLKRWAKPEPRSVSIWNRPGYAQVHRQPLGVVGIVVPWNYPLYLAAGPLVSALGAGNRAMIKLSEAAPRFGEVFARLVRDTFAEDEVAAVNGGVEVGEAFVRLPFDHLLFTGSTRVGREVMRAASEHLTPVTLELGGKSPVIFCDDFPVELAARRIMYGKCVNAGQTCVAPDYALVPGSRLDAFIAAAGRAVKTYFPSLRSPDYTSIASDRQYARLRGYLDDAIEKGAVAHPLHPEASDPAARKLTPTVLTGVNLAMRVMQEEIFGPILPVIPYERLDEAIGFVNARPHPLALYAFSNDRTVVDRILSGTISGGVTVNDTMLHVAQDALPFGGVGPSGMGVYHGREGFDAFSKLRGVYYQSRINGVSLLQPPYGARFKRLIGLMLR
jgi:acyl-CoA reductase-like NAD-dependent aldehyde dehydrogenase